jgi:hypothetical protein
LGDVPPLPSDDGELKLSFRPGPERDYLRIGAAVFVGVVILGIVVFSVTELSSGFLPMDDRYLEVLQPETEDGVLPVALNELANLLEDNQISVSGRVTNTSLEPLENLMVVITARETTGRFPQTLEVPVEPAVLEPEEIGFFSLAVTLPQRPDSYSVRFRLENGPYLSHSDARTYSFEVPIP